MIGWFGLVVVALASFRLTRVITDDKIGLPLRDRIYHFAWDDENAVVQRTADGEVFVPSPRAPWRTWVWTLFTCGWCMGFWVAAGVYSAWRWWDVEAVRAVITVFAVAGAAGLLHTLSFAGED